MHNDEGPSPGLLAARERSRVAEEKLRQHLLGGGNTRSFQQAQPSEITRAIPEQTYKVLSLCPDHGLTLRRLACALDLRCELVAVQAATMLLARSCPAALVRLNLARCCRRASSRATATWRPAIHLLEVQDMGVAIPALLVQVLTLFSLPKPMHR